MPDAANAPQTSNPDNRVDSDGGPRYTETPRDPLAPDAPIPAEPWNTVTASFFIVLVVVWLVRLRGRFRLFPFMAACLPILAVGAVAGTLYHATRTRNIYFKLDYIPISLLGLAAAIYLGVRLGRTSGMSLLRAMLLAIGVIVFYALVNIALFSFVVWEYPTLRVNLSYASMAIFILIPMVVTLIRTKFRYAGFIWAALGGFGIAWVCRLVDPSSPLPMGTHWLWHTFGCIATAFLFEYFYRLEGSPAPLPPPRSGEGE